MPLSAAKVCLLSTDGEVDRAIPYMHRKHQSKKKFGELPHYVKMLAA
jgi:hypothetical protein